MSNRQQNISSKFADLGRPRQIWAVSSIHGDAERLVALHNIIGPKFRPGDKLVYMGNYLGHGQGGLQVVDELLAFRRALLSIPGMDASDITYLRGQQEEMWHKLLQIQYSPDPKQIYSWMIDHGVGATIAAYGSDVERGRVASRDGAVTLTRWTSDLRAAMRQMPGHESFFSTLKRAAYTSDRDYRPVGLLFVHAGVDPRRPLGNQGDSFWWNARGFNEIPQPFENFTQVIRGYDPDHGGVVRGPYTMTIDGGCGFGGTLVCANFDLSGNIIDVTEV